LIEQKADANVKDDAGWTCLHWAAAEGDRELVRLLTEEGCCEVNARLIHVNRPFLDTPLFFAANEGHVSVCQYLINHGAAINAANHEGETPLMYACRNPNAWKLERDIRSCNKDPDAVAELERLKRNLEDCRLQTCAMLVDAKANVHAQARNGMSVLHLCAELGHVDVARLLLDNKAQIDAQNMVGTTSLMEALQHGSMGVLELLVLRKGNMEARDRNGCTPLIFAAGKGEMNVCKLLLENKANVDAKANNGYTCLMGAVLNGHLNVCELLFRTNAAIDAQDKYGRTSLMMAVFSGNLSICKSLIAHNADTSLMMAEDGIRYTALDIARMLKHTDIANFLSDARGRASVEACVSQPLQRPRVKAAQTERGAAIQGEEGDMKRVHKKGNAAVLPPAKKQRK
jgi:ankyrin repeat protein